MHPRTEELQAHLTRQRRVLIDAVDQVPPARRELHPDDGSWSCAQVLEHLSLVERQVGALLGRGLRAALAEGLPRETEASPVLDEADASAVLDRQRRLQAPPGAAALTGLDSSAALRALEQSRARLLEVLHAADGYAVGAIRARHPLLGELDFHQWMAFVGWHEGRHAEQIRALG